MSIKKMNLYFTYESRDLSHLLCLSDTVRAITKLNVGHRNKFKINRRSSSLQTTQNWSFQVVVLERTTKQCTKSYNAYAQLLFCPLNFLFSDVPVPVALVVFLNFLTLAFHCSQQ